MSGAFRAKLAALRGVRHIEIYALLFVVALAFLLLNQGGGQSGLSAQTGTPAVNADAETAANLEGATALERRIERVLSQVRGAGRVRVLVREKGEGVAAFGAIERGDAKTTEGVVVVAEGAGSVRVQLELQRAVKALLGIELERIEVLAMEDQ